jgi:orotidine-5'-phosphate decarboxylase
LPLNQSSLELKNPVIAALDVDSAEECLRLANLLAGRVGAFKIGPRLCMRYGAHLVEELAKAAPVFVDNKYLDIPSTMVAAIRATFESGATLATVHAWSGPEALALLAQTEVELNKIRPFKILAVTVLTSFDDQTLLVELKTNRSAGRHAKQPPGGQATQPSAAQADPGSAPQTIASQVLALAKVSLQAGLSGLVCSSQEVAHLRQLSAQAFLVVPGIRLPTDAAGDQKRIKTPGEARRLGASALVIGRPLYAAADPVAALEKIFANLAAAGT